MNTMPEWRLAGDWFDICSCNIPCPCEFAQAPTNNACLGMLVWHIREGTFGDIRLDGFNLLALAGFEGNLWADGRHYKPSSPARLVAGQLVLPLV